MQIEVDSLRVATKLVTEDKDRVADAGKKATQTEMIHTVLLEAGHVMHVKEVSQAIKKKYDVQIKSAYVAPVIHRNLGKIFAKADRPNTFGLAEWPEKAQPQLSIVSR